jgi:dihydroorotase/N-acyl-D-amino-acid deacylase
VSPQLRLNLRQEFKVSRVIFVLCTVAITVPLIGRSPAAQTAEAFDLVITNGHIIDGTGSPWYAADLAIRNGRVAAIGRLHDAPRRHTIDAAGRIVAPGFIDMLGQSDYSMLLDPHVPSKVFQGITTEITGEGETAAPLNAAIIAADKAIYDHLRIKPDWTTFRQYFRRLERVGLGINLASYVGATNVRRIVLGDGDVQPNAAQLDAMRALVRDSMQDGAIGLSSALQYAPAPFAKTPELVALATEAARQGGIYATHMRSESDAETDAIAEAVQIGREAGVAVEIWHLKAAGQANWGTMARVVAQIEAARAAGVEISADTYAYTAWFNTFSAFIPPWAHDGGDAALIERLKDPATRERIHHDVLTPSGTWDNEWLEIPGPQAILLAVVQNPDLLPLQGKRLSEIAALWHEDPFDALCDILIKDKAFTSVAVFGMDEPDVSLALRQPWVSIDNDSQGTSPDGPLADEHPHPRAYGTFPRILRKYVREEHLLSLEEAIRKFSALPALKMRLSDRGVIKRGMWADLVVFDPSTVTDLATFEKPNQLSRGIDDVIVNGVPVLAGGKLTQALPGKVLRGPGATMTSQRDQ